MDTYVVLSRYGWQTAGDLSAADTRSQEEAARLEEVDRLRSYVLEERDGTLGTVCVYRAASPEAIRRHAAAAEFPVDEIVKVVDPVTARADSPRAVT